MKLFIRQLTIVLFFSGLGFMPSVHAQKYFCGHTEVEHQQHQLQSNGASQLRLSAGETIYYPIQAHILKKTQDTAATTSMEVVKSIVKLNKNFEAAHIQFYLSDPIQYIVDTFYIYKSLYQSKLSSLYCRPSVINIFFVKDIMNYSNPQDQYPTFPIGLAPIGGNSSFPILIDGDYVSSDNVLTHEMGHYFSLQHTVQDGGNNYMKPINFEGQGAFTETQLAAISAETATAKKTSMAKSSIDQVVSPSGLTAAFSEFSKVRLAWKDNASNELGYVVERSVHPDSAFVQVDFADINAQEVFDYQLESNMTYYYRVRAGNSAVYSSVASVKTGISYCHPQNESKCARGTPDLSIKSFTIAGIPYAVNPNDDCSGYGYVYPTSLKFKSDSTYAFSVAMYTTAAAKDLAFYNNVIQKSGQPSWTIASIQYKLNIVVWIDINGNGIFEASEKQFEGLAAKNSTVVSGILQLPLLANPIKTLMRVRAIWKASIFYQNTNIMKTIDPCLPHAEGETEDYVVEIDPLVTALESSQLLAKSSFYPNPSNGKLFLGSETSQCEILDLNGDVLLRFENTSSSEIQLSTLPNGLYIVRLTHARGENSFEKLIMER